MKIAEVRKRAFAMPLTDPSFPPAPYRFRLYRFRPIDHNGARRLDSIRG